MFYALKSSSYHEFPFLIFRGDCAYAICKTVVLILNLLFPGIIRYVGFVKWGLKKCNSHCHSFYHILIWEIRIARFLSGFLFLLLIPPHYAFNYE